MPAFTDNMHIPVGPLHPDSHPIHTSRFAGALWCQSCPHPKTKFFFVNRNQRRIWPPHGVRLLTQILRGSHSAKSTLVCVTDVSYPAQNKDFEQTRQRGIQWGTKCLPYSPRFVKDFELVDFEFGVIFVSRAHTRANHSNSPNSRTT